MEHYKQQIQSAPRAIQTLKALRAQTTGFQGNEPQMNAPAPETVESSVLQGDLSHFNPFGTDFIDDAWFSQHITNVDWLELCWWSNDHLMILLWVGKEMTVTESVKELDHRWQRI